MTTDVPESEIRSEVDRISRALGKKPPKEIEVEEGILLRGPRLEDDGQKIVLHGGWGLKDLQDQIVWTLFEQDLKNHEDPLVRNPHRYDMFLTVLLFAGFALVILVSMYVQFFVRLLILAALVVSYLCGIYKLSPRKRAYAEFVGNAMLKTNHWPEERVEEFVKDSHKMGWGLAALMATILFVAGIAFAFIFSL